jgi:hypothetical protein
LVYNPTSFSEQEADAKQDFVQIKI